MKRYSFDEIFYSLPDGSITPKKRIKVGGIEFGPGVTFGPGVFFAGVDFHKYKNLDIAADEEGETLEIKGFFKV